MMENELFKQIFNSPEVMKIMAHLFMWRQVAKPVCSFINGAIAKYVADTPSKKDDKKLAKFFNNPKVKLVMYIADMIFSIKIQLPEKKNEPAQ